MIDTTHSILDYHADTSHVCGRIPARALNPEEQPIPFKLYRNQQPFHLPQQFTLPDIALDAILDPAEIPGQAHAASMAETLGAVCNLATGITQVKKLDQGAFFHLRSIPSAGALYPTELYVALQNVNEINDGLYHYSPLEHTLTALRSGQIFSALAGDQPIVRFYLTSIFHRSAWKYGKRAYRYCLLDAGHAAENLVVSCRLHGLRARLDHDFDDAFVNRLLCLDPALEGCLAQVHALGCSQETAIYDSVMPVAEGLEQWSRCSTNATIPEAILRAHALSSAQGNPMRPRPAAHEQDATPLPDPVARASAPATIQRRRSKRNFITAPAPTRDLNDILGLLCTTTNAGSAKAARISFLAGESSGLVPGYHHLDQASCSTVLVRSGDFMARSARVCLDQGWLENAALHIAFTADLAGLEAEHGPRSYRAAFLEAGRLGQRAYLAATAKRLGACGIGAFFDQEAASLLSLPDGHALLYLIAVGPVRH